MDQPAIQDSIVELLATQGAKPRGYIEATLVYQHGRAPHEVTVALRTLLSTKRLHRETLAIEAFNISVHIYALSPLTEDDLSTLKHLILRKHSIFDREALRQCGEGYLRSLLIRSRAYTSIPQQKRLGMLEVAGTRLTSDLVATFASDEQPVRLTLESKNCRQVFYSNANIYKPLLQKAILLDATPILCVAHMSNEARQLCNTIGVATIVFERQFAWKRQRKAIESLRCVIGPEPVEFIGKRYYQNDSTLPSSAVRDLEIVSNRDWIASANKTWASHRDSIAYHLNDTWPGLRRFVNKIQM